MGWPGMTSDARRLAARALGDAGRKYLGDLGMRRRGSSARLWWLDRGWWLVNVEFQASGGSVGTYVNVGLQHLWDVRDGRTFEYAARVPIGKSRSQFVDLVGKDAQATVRATAEATTEAAADAAGQATAGQATAETTVRATAEAAGQAAAQAVREWVARLGDDDQHLQWLRDNPGDLLNSAIATQLAGGNGKDAFLAAAAVLDPGIEWQREMAADCRQLAALTDEPARFDKPARFRETIAERIRTTRAHLRLDVSTSGSGLFGSSRAPEGAGTRTRRLYDAALEPAPSHQCR